ncbi:ABC transporter substrate-binding protein [Anaerocolumna aminovalerica]|uniref:ABC transporter substrate-binding protein n=1 Tax=Anaerocolumna aminovalerica TaxID=1527 RepID=UPI000BE41DBB|nr:ABC transporter substrate-binding protein [Anaerocolumna aminovalerica]
MKKNSSRRIALLLITAAMVALTACGKKNADNSVGNLTADHDNGANTEGGNSGNIVNIGVTDTIGSLNPLLQDGTEVVKYAASLSFLSLVELNKNLEFEAQIAKEITTEDNKHFTIKLDENATWSDGTPITSKDVLFSFLCWASPEVGNTGMSIYKIEGIGDDGYVETGAEEISGIKAIDEKTVEITTKSEMALYAFNNTYGRYILILPEHILGSVPKEDLLTYKWFNTPNVISGPYFITDFDLNHYVTYVANDNYWKGSPKIKSLNIKVVTSSQLLAGLQSGEIDLVQQTMGVILQEDYESVEALSNITVFEGTPVTNQSIFINTDNIRDVRIRQAILYGIDREIILNEILKGNGEIVDGFLASAGPFYDSSLKPTEYNPQKAAALVKEAEADGWDPSTQYAFYVNSGDTTFTQVASFYTAQLAEIGINLKVNTVDLSTLMSVAGSREFDIMAVQYTFTPVDPYTDVDWLLSKDGWTGYYNEEVAAALVKTQTVKDNEEIKNLYLTIDTYVQKEVPMISAYIISALGAKSNRLQNAVPDVYGTFLNVHEWEIAE